MESSSSRKQHTVVVPTKLKTVLLPGSPPEIAYASPQPQQQFYEARTSIPFTNAMGTETKKTVRMDESMENARRIVTVEQTSRIIKFGDTNTTSVQKQQRANYYVPKPKKFVQGQFRESDFSAISLTCFVNKMYFSLVIGNTSILPSNALAISMMIKCES